MSDNFFLERQGAAVMKHGVLSRYIRLFSQKTGKYAPGHSVVYVDGYAGPGVYDDGNAGSPLIAAEVSALVDHVRDLRCYFVEESPVHADKLEEALAESLPSATVMQGRMEDYIDELLNASAGLPMLVFVDPFGLGLRFDSLKRLAQRSEPTDIIVNVSLSAVRRYSGHLTSGKDYPARQAFIEKLDRALDGEWWQEMLVEAGPEAICEEFCSRCASLRGATSWTPIRDRWDGPTAFYLLLITRHFDGLTAFIDFVSLAHEELRAADPAALTDDEMLIPLAHDWIGAIQTAVIAILDDVGPFRVKDELNRVFGEAEGFAREKHLRKALKDLGLVLTPPTGSVYQMSVRRP